MGRELPIVKLGNSNGVQVGDWVLAIGSPFGLQSTVTAGIISAKDRGNVGHQFQHFLQTDAAINPGNSGGPLVDISGQVIGINTAIMTGGRGNEGVGFALPSNMAIGVYNQIIGTARSLAALSASASPRTRARIRLCFATSGPATAWCCSPSSRAVPPIRWASRPGDVVTAINGRPVKTGSDLVDPIAQTPIGDKVQITYLRNRQERQTTLVVQDRSKVFSDRVASDTDGDDIAPVPGEPAPTEFGLRVEELTPERAQRAGYNNLHGVVVTEVEPASTAEDIGFLRGDLIEEVDHNEVTSLPVYRKFLSALRPGQQAVFKVVRHGDTDRLLTVYLAGAVPAQ